MDGTDEKYKVFTTLLGRNDRGNIDDIKEGWSSQFVPFQKKTINNTLHLNFAKYDVTQSKVLKQSHLFSFAGEGLCILLQLFCLRFI